VPLCPPQIPNGLTWDGTQASVFRGQQLLSELMLLCNAVCVLVADSLSGLSPLFIGTEFDVSMWFKLKFMCFKEKRRHKEVRYIRVGNISLGKDHEHVI
jgi:hypothetical protein